MTITFDDYYISPMISLEFVHRICMQMGQLLWGEIVVLLIDSLNQN